MASSAPLERILEPQRPWRESLKRALIITRREVRDSFRDWRIISPIVLLTFFFPFLAQAFAASVSGFLATYGAQIIGERTIPFLLMIVGFFPISISLVIALETFVGEQERRSLEPLFSTPLTNTELYLGKALAAMIPPLLASFGGMTVYLLTLLGGQLAWRPPAMLIVQIFVLTIVQALVMVTGAVVVSSRTTSVRAANLLASFIIIPMSLIINGESFIMFIAPDAESPRGIGALWAITAGMLIVAVLFLRMGNSIFNREELLGRMIDTLRPLHTLRSIGRYIVATDDAGTPAANLLAWYRQAIPYSLGKLRAALAIVAGVFVVFFVAGYGFGQLPAYQLPLTGLDTSTDVGAFFSDFVVSGQQNSLVAAVFWQNSRVMLAALGFAIFSFGVGPLVLTPIVFAVLGYLLSQMLLNGLDMRLFFGGILPHGLVEIPTVWLGTAAAFYLGAIVTRPPQGQTLGQAWVMALGDVLKVFLGVVLPGLLLAAWLEVNLTPRVIAALFGA